MNTIPITPPTPPRRSHALCFVCLHSLFGFADIAPSGTGAGVALSTVLGSEFHAIVPVCLGLSAVHLGANFMSVRQLGVPTFDSQVTTRGGQEKANNVKAFCFARPVWCILRLAGLFFRARFSAFLDRAGERAADLFFVFCAALRLIPCLHYQRLEILTDTMIHGRGSGEVLTPQDMAGKRQARTCVLGCVLGDGMYCARV